MSIGEILDANEALVLMQDILHPPEPPKPKV